MRTSTTRASAAGLALIALTTTALSAGAASKEAATGSALNVTITAETTGPTQADVDAVRAMLPKHPQLAPLLKDTRFRLIETSVISQDSKDDQPAGPDLFYATIYDYTNQRAIVAQGEFRNHAQLEVKVHKGFQPIPSQEEYDEAVALLTSDAQVGQALVENRVFTYRPMPPILEVDPVTKEKMETRVINVGVMPKLGFDQVPHQIVGIDLASQKVVRYNRNAPMTAIAEASPNCGVTGANQQTTPRNTAGSATLTITDNGNTIWQMSVTRPSISAGTMASAIELKDVKYKGKSVLKRGHVPILNVKYVNDACGPYRDWQYQEGQFATGTGAFTDLAAGVRDLGTFQATTALENGTDTGNFRGVAIYRQGSEVVLVTEMEAGWYRYINEWRFDMNGTIRPRFGFGATTNGCTCLTHDHHVYFRLDFDVFQSNNTMYEVIGDPTAEFAERGRKITLEERFTRSATQQKYYRIVGGKRSYRLIPGPLDGIADTFGRGDMWLLRWKSGTTNLQQEIDDGHTSISSNCEADLAQFTNNEATDNQDIVVWYHATVRHSPTTNSFMCTPTGRGIPGRNILTGDKVVGPDLVPETF